eukprot:3098387-Pleurochrysis_carterae.AAC.3
MSESVGDPLQWRLTKLIFENQSIELPRSFCCYLATMIFNGSHILISLYSPHCCVIIDNAIGQIAIFDTIVNIAIGTDNIVTYREVQFVKLPAHATTFGSHTLLCILYLRRMGTSGAIRAPLPSFCITVRAHRCHCLNCSRREGTISFRARARSRNRWWLSH